MAMENFLSRMGLDSKQLTDRYAEYAEPMHDQHLFYGYEPSSHPHGHVIPTKHHYVGGHKNNAAMSALTLLAFLFFLHILQQCLKDHMTAHSCHVTPQVMIMTAGREGAENIAKLSNIKKFDKARALHADKNHFQAEMLSIKERNKESDDESDLESHFNPDISLPKSLLKIKTAEHTPPNGAQKYKIVKNHGNKSLMFGNSYELFDN